MDFVGRPPGEPRQAPPPYLAWNVDSCGLECENTPLRSTKGVLMGKGRPTERIPSRVLQEVAPVLRVPAHPHRLRIVEILMLESVSVAKLASMLKLEPPVVSQHLAQMRANRIVTPHREGKQVYYEVINPNATNLINCIRAHGAG